MTRRVGFVALAALLVWACSGAAQVPPGLAPPEYERPPLEPWPPADAGTSSPAPSADPDPGTPGEGAAGAAGSRALPAGSAKDPGTVTESESEIQAR